VPLPLKEKGRSQHTVFQSSRLKGAILLIALLVLLAGGWSFLNRLSQRALPTRQITPEISSLEESRPQRPPAKDAVLVAREREEAEMAMGTYLVGVKALSKMGAEDWGGSGFEEIVQLGEEGDRLFLHENYLSAMETFRQGAVKIEALEERAQAELRRLIGEGLAALSKKESGDAEKFFQAALKIDPGHAEALEGLKKAGIFKKARQWLASAQVYEAENNLPFALTDYQRAVQLVPDSQEARDGLERVKGQLLDEQFQDLLSTGLAAYHEGNLGKARRLILESASIKPGSSDVTAALALVNQAVQQKRIEKLRRKGLEEEEAEAWEEARNTYRDVLKIDRAIQFAVKGFARMETRLRLEGLAHAYMGRPEALESDRNLEKANRLLEDMKALDPKGPKWLSQIQTLDRLLGEARRKIRVVLLSDGQTDVAVYKIGIFGRFQQKNLTLRPGTYTVVGFRDGYKDVRAIVRIKPEDTEIQVRIVCVEKI
jgi:tetratricopeptide (TPR) repeat protein